MTFDDLAVTFDDLDVTFGDLAVTSGDPGGRGDACDMLVEVGSLSLPDQVTCLGRRVEVVAWLSRGGDDGRVAEAGGG